MWTKPEVVEIKMDAEISSYQDDDPLKDGPPFAGTVGAVSHGFVPTNSENERSTST